MGVLKTVYADSVRKKGGNYAQSRLKKTNDTLFHHFFFFHSHAQKCKLPLVVTSYADMFNSESGLPDIPFLKHAK